MRKWTLLFLLATAQPIVGLLAVEPAQAQIAVEGTPATTAETASGTSHTVNLPSSPQAGELLFMPISFDQENATFTLTDWSFIEGNSASSSTTSVGFGYKVATGSEGSTVSVGSNTTGQLTACAVRLSGVDTGDPTNSDNFVNTNVGSTTSTFNIAADTITSLTSGDGVLVMVSAEANRSVSSADADLTSICNINAGSSIHVYIDADTGGTGNVQYDFTMSDTRDYDLSLLQVVAAAGGGSSIATIMQNYARRRRQ